MSNVIGYVCIQSKIISWHFTYYINFFCLRMPNWFAANLPVITLYIEILITIPTLAYTIICFVNSAFGLPHPIWLSASPFITHFVKVYPLYSGHPINSFLPILILCQNFRLFFILFSISCFITIFVHWNLSIYRF